MTSNMNSFSKTVCASLFLNKAIDIVCMNLILKHQSLIIQKFPSYHYFNKA